MKTYLLYGQEYLSEKTNINTFVGVKILLTVDYWLDKNKYL